MIGMDFWPRDTKIVSNMPSVGVLKREKSAKGILLKFITFACLGWCPPVYFSSITSIRQLLKYIVKK